MKKIISILGIIAMLFVSLFGFTGCGAEEESKKSDSDNKEVVEEVKEDEDFINNNDSYYFMFDGKKYKAGDKISDLSNSGLQVREVEKEETVPANKYMIGAGYIQNAEKKTILNVVPYNTESSEVKIPDTCIGGVSFESDDIETDSRVATMEIYGGIKLGSTEEELKAIFGEPTSTYEGTNWNSYTYKSDEVYRNFEFRLNEGKVIYIKWQNLVFND